MAFDFKTIEKLLNLAKKHKLAELEVDDGKNKVRFKTKYGALSLAAPSAYAPEKNSERPLPLNESPKKLSGLDDDRYIKVMSPFVGTFYRSPSPEAESYVKEGQVVKKGDVLCIVEAMKLMNEIESESNGKIISVIAENGQPVEYGEPLFLIDPLS